MKTGIAKLKKEIALTEADVRLTALDLHQNRVLLTEQLKSTKIILSALISGFTLGFLVMPSKNKFLHSKKDKRISDARPSNTRKAITKLDMMSIVSNLVSYWRLFK